MARISLLAFVVATVASLTGCPTRNRVNCTTTSDCDLQGGGACLADSASGGSWCAYPSADCPSGMRWSDVDTDPSIAGTCVGDDDEIDAGVDATDAPIDAMVPDGPAVGPIMTGQYASIVLGQSDFTTSAANSNGQSASSLAGPGRVAIDGANLWVADGTNARVLQWNSIPIVDRPIANVVVGQASGTTSSPATTQTTLRVGSVGVHAASSCRQRWRSRACSGVTTM